MFNYQPSGAQKFINPTSMPDKKVLRMYRDDPRNNQMWIESCGMKVEIINEDAPISNPADPTYIKTLTSESSDPGSYYSENEAGIFNMQTQVMQNNEIASHIEAPTNVAVDTAGYRLEDASSSGDGSVRWIASITFDNVDGANSYEYVISARD